MEAFHEFMIDFVIFVFRKLVTFKYVTVMNLMLDLQFCII